MGTGVEKREAKATRRNEESYLIGEFGRSLRVIRCLYKTMRIERWSLRKILGNLRKEPRDDTVTGKLMRTLLEKSGIKRSGMKIRPQVTLWLYNLNSSTHLKVNSFASQKCEIIS